jgi:hypothetical protein
MTSIPPRNKKAKSTDSEIYRDYTEAKASNRPGRIGEVLLKHGISRSNLYDIIRRVQHGNPGAIRQDMETARINALWEHKYKPRYLALSKDRKADTIAALRKLIREMAADDFPQSAIAAKLGKDRSTVIHHLEN